MRATARSLLIGLGLAGCMLAGPAAFAATVSGPIGTTTLAQGDSGFPVRVLQGDLAQFGDYGGVVTGYFGPATTAALREFQHAHGLAATGVMNAATFQAIKVALGLGGGQAGAGTAATGSVRHWRTSHGTSSHATTGTNSGSSSGATSGTSSGSTAGSSSHATTGTSSGTSSGSTAGTSKTFVQGTASPTVSGGLQVGGKIDGLTITRVIHLTATAYGATAQDNYPYGAVDAFGVPLKPGDVAIDPSVIALNTKMYVTGYSTPYLPKGGELAVARDTGGAIKGDRIDMYINSTNESLINSFGIQHVTAYILGG